MDSTTISFVVLLLTSSMIVIAAGDSTWHHHHHHLNVDSMVNDSRYISYQDLMSSSIRFEDSNTTTFAQMLFDVARNQVIIGARDLLYRMSFDLELLESSFWEASPSEIRMCQDKGQSEQLCRNYIMVLQSHENHLYACGTYAFNPKCSWRQMENLTVATLDDGVGKCPFSPKTNITSHMSESGEMFVGSTTDFSGSDLAILRSDVIATKPGSRSGANGRFIRTKQYNSKWLDNPQFVGSFEAGAFVYFVFRENAVEYMNCGKTMYSRIARVCKSDPGGDQILKENWTSFLKARLNCSLPGEYPFYFNEIQGMTYSAEEDVLYGTFTTPQNSIYGSAVCAFSLAAINEAFQGPFKHQESIESSWKEMNTQHRSQFQCENQTSNLRYKHLFESSRFQLMDQSIQPMTIHPLYYSKMERFIHVALDITTTKSDERVHVLYISTEDNIIKKISVLANVRDAESPEACLIEIWQPEEKLSTRILNIEYLKVTDSLYVGTEKAVMRIPSQHCSRHVSRTSCINAMDPYCGWNDVMERCTSSKTDEGLERFWIQADTFKCPVLTAPIDGGWSTWSDWSKCNKHEPNEGSCLCRSRHCNNPSPKNSGKVCDGISTEVHNCTLNGGWTEWSAWSACSQSCGIAVKTRRRTCGNPKPAHGGRTCVGPDHAEIYCLHLPPCPAPKPQAVDGGWGPWGQWSECSAQCGGGFRIRRRLCNDPSPQNGGLECPGCDIDYENCNSHLCPEVKKLSSWTPWLIQVNESNRVVGETHVERRFRFACKATTSDVGSLRINLSKEETRVCRADGTCLRHNENSASVDDEHSAAAATAAAGGGHLSEWTPCTAYCGGGVQYRHREGKHHGKVVVSRMCNTHPCTSATPIAAIHNEWSCWTDWSACSVSCGVGVRRRTRKCLGAPEKSCNGKSLEEEECQMAACENFLGWSTWSEWSSCSSDGIRYRYRKCLIGQPTSTECQGDEFEKALCVPDPCTGAVIAKSSTVGSVLAFAILFYALSILVTFWLTRKRFLPTAAPVKNNSQSPNYDTYPNQYSSLPTKDMFDARPKVKRQCSFNMSSGSGSGSKNCNTGSLSKSNNMHHNHTPKVLAKTLNDCETATLKRNSHGLNNYRTNMDDEKF